MPNQALISRELQLKVQILGGTKIYLSCCVRGSGGALVWVIAEHLEAPVVTFKRLHF